MPNIVVLNQEGKELRELTLILKCLALSQISK